MGAWGTRAELRRWVEGWKVVRDFQRAEFRARRMTPAQALNEAEDLLDFAIELHGWPFDEDRRQARERAAVSRAWARLRRHYKTP